MHKQGTSDVLIYKLDTLGNILWVKNLVGPLGDDCNQFCIDYQDNLYLTGALFGTNGIHKLDSNGSFLWSKEIDDRIGSGSIVYQHIAYSQFDSTIVIGGSFVDTFHLDLLAVIDCYSNPNDPNQPSDNYLAKLDLNGQAIFLKSCALSCQWSDGFYDLSIKPSTGEIFYIYWYNGLNDVNHLGLTKCSPSGVTLSIRTYGTNYISGPFYHIEKISFDQDSLLGLLCNSTSEMFVFKLFDSQQNNLVRTFDATIP